MKISEEKLTFVLRLILFILYLALGAAVFQALEKETQEYDLENLRTLRQQILSKYNISKEDANILVDPYEEIFVEKFGMWTYGNSFTFAVTVVTTVGYGNMVPVTNGGRIFCVFYALAGIPGTCLVLKSIGDQIAILISVSITVFEKKCLRRAKPLKVKKKTTVVTVILTLCVVLPTVAAAVKLRRNDMTYFESVYFTFITLSTIGFGDFVPYYQHDAEYLLLLGMFIGLSFVSSIFCSLNLLLEKHGVGIQLSKALVRYRSRLRIKWASTGDLCESKADVKLKNFSNIRRCSSLQDLGTLAVGHHPEAGREVAEERGAAWVHIQREQPCSITENTET